MEVIKRGDVDMSKCHIATVSATQGGARRTHSKDLQGLTPACHPELVSGSINLIYPKSEQCCNNANDRSCHPEALAEGSPIKRVSKAILRRLAINGYGFRLSSSARRCLRRHSNFPSPREREQLLANL